MERGGRDVEIKTVAVIGAGVMGAQIAQVFAVSGFDVRLHDVREEALRAALERIEGHRFGLRRGVERGKLTAAEAEAALGRIAPTTDLAAACACLASREIGHRWRLDLATELAAVGGLHPR